MELPEKGNDIKDEECRHSEHGTIGNFEFRLEFALKM